MGLSHLLASVVPGLLHPVFGWLSKRSQFKHDEAMEKITIDEVRAEAKAGVQVAAEATKGAVAKGQLAGWLASYSLGAIKLPRGVKLPSWAGGLLAIAMFLQATMHPVILYGSIVGAALNPDPDGVWVHALLGVVSWALGAHVADFVGLGQKATPTEEHHE